MKEIYMRFFTISLLLLMTYSCAHHKDVRPGSSGIHTVSFETETKTEGHRSGLSQANHYCESLSKKAYVIKEKSKYIGDMDEKTYNRTKKVSKSAQKAGNYGRGNRYGKTTATEDSIGWGGAILDDLAGKAYLYTMTFKCR